MISEIINFIRNNVSSNDRPVVLYSSIWPLLKVFKLAPKDFPDEFMSELISAIGTNKTLLMPTFAAGYKNGFCNLDTEPSTTGLLSEVFRKNFRSKRTKSAFFSFNVIGDKANEIINLCPLYAWGESSIYEWMEQNNAHIITIGIHPTHISFLHRLEWLVKDLINYRTIKEFSGTLILDSTEHQTKETLFVRSYAPVAENDFTPLLPYLFESGMKTIDFLGIQITHSSAKNIVDVCLPVFKNEPNIVLKNKFDFI